MTNHYLHMNVELFLHLDPSVQERVTNEIGVRLSSRFEKEFFVILYQVESFYVEAFYHRKQKQLSSLSAFTHTDRLKPYFNSIDISHLFRK